MSVRASAPPNARLCDVKWLARACRAASVWTWQAAGALPLEDVVLEQRALAERDLGHGVGEVAAVAGVAWTTEACERSPARMRTRGYWTSAPATRRPSGT